MISSIKKIIKISAKGFYLAADKLGKKQERCLSFTKENKKWIW